MSHLDILIPFSLPSAALGPDLLRSMQTPALALLLGRSQPHQHHIQDAFARALPHESWLADAFDVPMDAASSSSPPIVLHAMRGLGVGTTQGSWFVLNPVHLHIARDHLVMTDQRRLDLAPADSRELFAIAESVFAEHDKQLVYGDATHWFLRADSWRDLQTATPDVTCGHNIDIWMPRGSSERDWRKAHNEIQMHWHASTINQQRTEHSQLPVNALWLWGGTTAPVRPLKSCYGAGFNLPGWINEVGALEWDSQDNASAEEVIMAGDAHSLLQLDDLMAPAIADDMSEWLLRMHALEQAWFAPLLQALQQGTLERCRLILTHGTVTTVVPVTRNGLRRFWKKPSLQGLLE